MRMRVFNRFKLVAFLTAITFVIGTTSCGDSDKKGSAGAGGSGVALGAAAGCAILAGSTVTNTGPTVITGGGVFLNPGSPGVRLPPRTFFRTIPVPPQPRPPPTPIGLTPPYKKLASQPSGTSFAGAN